MQKCCHSFSENESKWVEICSVTASLFMTLSVGVMIHYVCKTKDMIIDFRKHAPTHDSTIIQGQFVGVCWKYLGTVIDSELTFNKSCEAVCKKGYQLLSCLRKLSQFNIDVTVLTLCSGALIEFPFILDSLKQIMKWASRLIGESHLNTWQCCTPHSFSWRPTLFLWTVPTRVPAPSLWSSWCGDSFVPAAMEGRTSSIALWALQAPVGIGFHCCLLVVCFYVYELIRCDVNFLN